MPYRQPEPSPIEEKFWEVAKDVIPELERQAKIGRYRVDFLARKTMVVIELYGYLWHNSKKKITRDKARERELTRMGYTVYPFTGSEIHEDTQRCVEEVIALLKTKGEIHTPNNHYTKMAQTTGEIVKIELTKEPPKWTPPRKKKILGLTAPQLAILALLGTVIMTTLTAAAGMTFITFEEKPNEQAQAISTTSPAIAEAKPAPENKTQELFPFTGNATGLCTITALIIISGLLGGGETVRRRRWRRRY